MGSPSSRRAWIEIISQIETDINNLSPSSRRAWIEIQTGSWDDTSRQVALLAEGVDRNFSTMMYLYVVEVALLAEGVDRNTSS